MWVEVVKPYVAHLGKKGELRDIPSGEAEIHVLLGNAVEVNPPKNPEIEIEPPVQRKKRAYRRRDLRAEE